MPTAAKLMAAICLALLAFIVSQMIMPLMPERSYFGYFVPINMAVGALVGWVIMAPRAGHGMAAGITNGLTGAFMLVFWGLATHAVIRMLDLSMQRRYDGVGEGLLAVLTISAEFILVMATVPIGIVLIVGGILSGIATNFAERRWP